MLAKEKEIIHAAAVLRRGGLVAFPTETVYGLGADATNAKAVARIFAAKGRPATNPLIVHVADIATACGYAARWPKKAGRLAAAFWPGPLTLVVPADPRICPLVTAGLKTVGLRVPDHPVALALLREFGGPVAAPSANRSNHVSPTTAAHVRRDLGKRIDMVLDGGSCRVGIESTVLDLAGRIPRILRPGGVSQAEIEAVIGPVEFAKPLDAPDQSSASPGRQPVHYSPTTPAFRFEHRRRARLRKFASDDPTLDIAILTFWGKLSDNSGCRIEFHPMPVNPADYARQIYAVLREVDARKFDAICIELPPNRPAWHAIRDRLLRATRPF